MFERDVVWNVSPTKCMTCYIIIKCELTVLHTLRLSACTGHCGHENTALKVLVSPEVRSLYMALQSIIE